MTRRRPEVGIGAVVEHGGAILLIERATPPNQGLWAIPGGRLEFGETLQQAAEREIREETGIVIRAGEVIYTTEFLDYDAQGEVQYHYVILDLRGDYLSGEVSAGDDASAAAWVPFAQLDRLALTDSTSTALQQLFPNHYPTILSEA